MSNWSGGGKRQGANKGWRGKEDASGESSHQWQARTGGQGRRGPSSRRRLQSHWFVYSALGAILLGAFLYLLLLRPVRTPVLLAMGTAYEAPVRPNQWAQEDRDALVELGTLSVSEVTGNWLGTNSDGWKALASLLEDHKDLRRGFRQVREPLVIYFSMPGVVNEDGDPCLLPPGTEPLKSDEWLKVDDIVEQIRKTVPDERHKLLVLDCNQELVNWSMGIVYNTFTERLKQYVERCAVPNLAVLTAADQGQVSWSSPRLGGTAFGQFLRLGLAGSADLASPNPDSEVTLNELSKYLKTAVGNWARTSRFAVQEPVLLKTDDELDFIVTYSQTEGSIEGYFESLKKGRFNPSVSTDDLSSLWGQLDKLRKVDVVRFDPIALSEFERDLLRLEQLAYGGAAYATDADKLSKELADRLAEAVARAKDNNQSLADCWAITNPVAASKSRITQGLSSLPLRRYFGQSDEAAISQIKGFLNSLSNISKGMDPGKLQLDPTVIQAAYLLPETQILLAAQKQHVVQGEERTAYLDEILRLRSHAEEMAVPSEGTVTNQVPTDAAVSKEILERAGDERAHYFVRRALDDADRKRHLAEDALFVASMETPQRQLLMDASRTYDSAAETRDGASFAFKILDRSYSELPYLAAWLCRLHRIGVGDDSAVDIKELLDMVHEIHNLGKAINDLQRIGEQPDEIATILAAAKRIDERVQEYAGEFKSVADGLKDATVRDGKELAELDSLLAVPLLPVDLRIDLLKKRNALALTLHNQHLEAMDATGVASEKSSATNGEKPRSDDSASVPAALAETIASWDEPPLIALLAPGGVTTESDDEDVLDRLNELSWAARKMLFGLRGLNVQGAPVSEMGNGNVSYLEDRLALSHAERQIRAAVGFGIRLREVDPITRLRSFDLQQLLIWHARRALDDFWHGVAGSDPRSLEELLTPIAGSAPQSPYPLFAKTAEEYLLAAEGMYEPIPQGTRLQLESLRQLADDRAAASRHGIQISGTTQPVSDSRNDVEVDVEFRPDPQGPNLPAGVAAIYLTDERNSLVRSSLSDSSRGYLTLPFAIGRSESWDGRARDVQSSALNAIVFFRGRQYSEPVTVNSLGGSVVQYEPPAPDRQSITLLGDQPAPPSIVFILDCSHSMTAEMPTEKGDVQPQMDIAKTAFERMLDELSTRRVSRPRIGVSFYGHRVAWKVQKPGQPPKWEVLTNKPAADGLIPNDLPPGEDVEQILPLGVFGPKEFGYVTKRLFSVKPWGITPVYLSIIQALDEFGNQDDRYSKSIVVVTDGKNNQEHDLSSGFRAPPLIEPDTVLQKWRSVKKEIPIYIVGFGIPEGEERDAVLEFRNIADATKGKFVPARTEGDLIKYLQQRLDINGYVVRTVEGDQRTAFTVDDSTGEEKPVALNSEVIMRTGEIHPPVKVEVEFQSIVKPVKFEGGEALRMRVNRNGDDIVAVPYDADVAAEANLAGGNSGTLIAPLLRVHRPKKADDDVRFRFSVQDQDSHFTPRPQEVWIEVTPEESPDTYLYYDRVFELDTPVPVVSFTASSWPEDTSFARVKFWCAETEIDPVLSLRLAEVRGLESESPVFQTIPDVEGVQVHIGLRKEGPDRYSVLVEERHDEKSPSMGAIRVRLVAADQSLTPRSVSHRFDVANRLARHQFSFQTGLSQRDFAEQVSVNIASGAALKQSSLRVEDADGLRVRIVNEDATLAPGAVEASSL